MPKEKFYSPDKVEGDEPDLVVAWGAGRAALGNTGNSTGLHLHWDDRDVSGLNRLIRALKRARDHVLDSD